MRFKSMLLTLICAMALALSATSCTNESKPENVASGHNNLQIYVYQKDFLLKDAINQYNSMYKDVPIEMIEYQDNEVEKYRNQLAVSFSAGDVPDILFVYHELYPSLYKMMENKLLCNLNEIIKQDSEFNLDDYNKKVLDSGIYRGERCFIPLYSYLPLLWTTEDILCNNSVNIGNTEWTWKDAEKIVKDYMGRNNTGEKYFFAFSFEFGEILKSCMPNLIDYSKKKTQFNTSEFIELLKTYKDIYPSICPDEEMAKYKGWEFGMMQSSDLVMANAIGACGVEGLWAKSSAVAALLESSLKLYPYPRCASDSPISAVPEFFIGIASECKEKKEAFRLIKILLSKEKQMNQNYAPTPVNNQAFKEYIEKYSAQEQASKELYNEIGKYLSVSLPTALVEKYESIFNSMGDSYLIDDEVMNMIEDELTQYMNNKESAEQAAKALNEKVMLFLNE